MTDRLDNERRIHRIKADQDAINNKTHESDTIAYLTKAIARDKATMEMKISDLVLARQVAEQKYSFRVVQIGELCDARRQGRAGEGREEGCSRHPIQSRIVGFFRKVKDSVLGLFGRKQQTQVGAAAGHSRSPQP